MPASSPPIEWLTAMPDPATARRRPLLFGLVFAACLAGSLAYVWQRAPVYQSSASLLTLAPADLDQPEAEVNPQQIALQRQSLLDPSLLEEIPRRLESTQSPADPADLSVDALRAMLSVASVRDTNVLELKARSSQPEWLAPIVQAWIDAYQARRARSATERQDQAFLALQEEATRLSEQAETKRHALDQFRRRHGIVTQNGADNQAMARLTGLNGAVNKASEAEVEAKSKLDAVEAAIAKGEPVVPPRDEQGLAQLQFNAHLLREKAKGLEQRYTPQYIALHPDLRGVQKELEQAEADIRKLLDEGKRAALSEAKQASASAAQSAQAIRAQAAAHQKEAAEFTARFAEQTALEDAVKRLDESTREIQARLAAVQAKPVERLPHIEVVERPYPPVRPLWPDYWQDSGIALLGSLGTALLTLLVFDFLTRREPNPAPMILPSIQVYAAPTNPALPQQSPQLAALPEQRTAALEPPWPRALSLGEIEQLRDGAGLAARQVLGFLLSGLSLDEAATLRAEHIDLANARLHVDGTVPRELILAPRLRDWLAESGGAPAWSAESAPEPDELAAGLACAAVDAGLAEPESVDATALRHTYILYLVKLGIRLADLDKVIGKTPAKSLAAYARHSPPGQGLKADALTLIHPALATEPTTP
jgi:succinoglycan biosynthesis transport protein ExoP